jgi:hypothetical protein
MSRRSVRYLTVAVMLVLALSFAGPARAAVGTFEAAVPAVQNCNWLDLFLGWLGSFWGDSAPTSVDKTTATVPVGPTGGEGGTTSATTTGNSGSREQGGTIDPDG